MSTIVQMGLENACVATVLACVAAAVGTSFRGRPAVAHCLWLLVLVKLVTPPIWDVAVPIPWFDSRVAEKESPSSELPIAGELVIPDIVVVTEAEAPAEFAKPFPFVHRDRVGEASGSARAIAARLWPAAPLIWLSGSIVMLSSLLIRVRRFRRALELATPAPDAVRTQVELLSDRVGLARPPAVVFVEAAVSPLVWSLDGAPLLVLPRELWKRLDGKRRETLIVHELAHLRRRDHWVRLLEMGVTVLYWWLPVVWWARNALREAEEQCCDAWVVSEFPGAARAYAETLLETVDFLSGPRSDLPIAASGLGHAQHLKRRLVMIMRRTTPKTLSLPGSLAAIAFSTLVLPFGATWAQEPKEEKEVRVVVRTDAPNIEEEVELTGNVVFNYTLADEELADDDSGDEQAEAVKKAILVLKQKLAKAKEKGADAGRTQEESKAIQSAIESLQQSISGKKGTTSEPRVVIAKRLARDNVEAKLDLTSEQTAEREKLREELGSLGKERKLAQDRLREVAQREAAARKKLAALDGKRVQVITRSNVLDDGKQKGDKEAKTVRFTSPNVVTKPVERTETRTFSFTKPNAESRISSLEKKLETMLEELRALKSEGSDSKPRAR